MQRFIFVCAFFITGLSSFGQFNDTTALSRYIRDTIKDRRPAQINAVEVQKALLGLLRLSAKDSLLPGTNISIRDSVGHGKVIDATGEDLSAFKFITQYNDTSFAIHNQNGDSVLVVIKGVTGSLTPSDPDLQDVTDKDSVTTHRITAGGLRLTNMSQYAIPYMAALGVLTQDSAGLSYDGHDFRVGHNDPSTLSGFSINGGRASIQAALGGLLFNVGSGFVPGTYDGTKHYTFQNRGNTYLDIYSVGTGPWAHYADFSTFLRVSTLATGGTAPVTTGATKVVIADANGLCSTSTLGGAFTSTSAMVTNITTLTSSPVINYINTGSMVNAQVSVGVAPTSTGLTEFSITLPFATTAAAGSYIGTAVVAENGGAAMASAAVYLVNSTTVKVRYIASIIALGTCSIVMVYPK